MSRDPIEALAAAAEAEAERERRTYSPEPDQAPDPTPKPEGEPIPGAEILEALRRNEDGDAALFVGLNRGRLLYDHAAGQWFTWAGHHWEPDTREESLAGVVKVSDLYLAEMKRQAWARLKAERAGRTKEADRAKSLEGALSRRVRDLQTIRRKQAVLHLARAGADTLGISGDEWDRDPWALPVLNGIIDLRTGEHRPGEPSDYFKSYAPTPWEGIDTKAPTWAAFLESTFAHDAELVAFVRRLFGYSASGQTTEAVLPILEGAGRNGKTVLLQAMAETLGPDLSGPIESEMLLESRFHRPSGGPSSDLLHLRGRRLAWLSETNENRRLNAGRAKLFTGGDLITGRAPYAARQVTFRPTHKLFLLTNHKPKADAQDFALWQRVLLIPFTQVFLTNPDPSNPNERKADLHLAEKLRNERPGILAWFVRGCLEWQRQGLNPPESVKGATAGYRDSEDIIKTFLAERCIEGPEMRVRAGEFYQAFRAWAEANGERPMTGTKFGRAMKDLFNSEKNMSGKFYMGIGLTT
ncbi:MAG TPA: phage/plasmid primase, P4 family [Syntrophales bacterium]|nr:phage/plasmid primase, P4 family [Syntrophales bacterium]